MFWWWHAGTCCLNMAIPIYFFPSKYGDFQSFFLKKSFVGFAIVLFYFFSLKKRTSKWWLSSFSHEIQVCLPISFNLPLSIRLCVYALCVVFMSVYKNMTSSLYIDIQLSSLYMTLLLKSISLSLYPTSLATYHSSYRNYIRPHQNTWHSFVIDGLHLHSFVVV